MVSADTTITISGDRPRGGVASNPVETITWAEAILAAAFLTLVSELICSDCKRRGVMFRVCCMVWISCWLPTPYIWLSRLWHWLQLGASWYCSLHIWHRPKSLPCISLCQAIGTEQDVHSGTWPHSLHTCHEARHLLLCMSSIFLPVDIYLVIAAWASSENGYDFSRRISTVYILDAGVS